MMIIKVLYFASAREDIGLREERLQLSDESNTTLASLRRLLLDKYPHVTPTIESIMFVLNFEYSDNNVTFTDGDEGALVPLISGR